MSARAGAVVCGAGIAGVAAAEALTAAGLRDLVLVDERPPLTLTSDKSTECYRDWWPGPDDAMHRLTSRSIDRLEALARETANRFRLNRRGYLFVTAEAEGVERLRAEAEERTALGAGPLRVHEGSGCASYRPAAPEGFEDEPRGADLLVGGGLVRRHFPYLAPGVRAALHARRCGWMSAQQLGACLLERARARGARLVRARLETVEVGGDGVRAVELVAGGGTHRIETPVLVLAAGPFLGREARRLGLGLPIACEGHVKLSFEDRAGAIAREAPLLVGADPVRLPFTPEERVVLAGEPEGRRLLEPFPAGVHGRPEGRGTAVLLYWTYESTGAEPVFPVPWDPHYPEIVVRGMSVVVPGLAAYTEHRPGAFVDGGYYAKAPDNRPLVGPLPVPGAFVVGGLSGYGIMAAAAAGELLAAHVRGQALPGYAPAFDPGRFEDPVYRAAVAGAAGSGQL